MKNLGWIYSSSGASGDASGPTYDESLGDDHSYSGPTSSAIVGETVAFGDILYKDKSENKWKKAKGDSINTMPATRIALETKNDGESCSMLRAGGSIRDDSWSWTSDDSKIELYVSSNTAGTLTESPPVTAGNVSQIVGNILSSNIIEFLPSMILGRF